MSPRPRVRQPGCSATLSPASSKTSANQVSEKAMFRSPSHGYGQFFVWRRLAAVEIDVASVDVAFIIMIFATNFVGCLHATCRGGQLGVGRGLALMQFDVARARVDIVLLP